MNAVAAAEAPRKARRLTRVRGEGELFWVFIFGAGFDCLGKGNLISGYFFPHKSWGFAALVLKGSSTLRPVRADS